LDGSKISIFLDVRYPGPDLAHQQHDARELIAMAPNAVVATSTPTARALRNLTRTIPIVFVGLSDLVTTGIVSNPILLRWSRRLPPQVTAAAASSSMSTVSCAAQIPGNYLGAIRDRASSLSST